MPLFGEFFARHPLRALLAGQPGCPFPRAGTRAWRDLDPDLRAQALGLADQYRDQPYALLTAGQYMAFVRDGSRRAFEEPYFQRRCKLCAALLGVCAGGDPQDVLQAADGLWTLCEETSWVISAHNDSTPERPLPDPDRPGLDLFAAQTGMILALACELLRDPLDALTPMLRERAWREIDRRVLRPFDTRDDLWWMGLTRRDLNNWTPWIVSNVMLCALLVPDGPERLCARLERGCEMLDRYLACLPDDGGCDEGAGYWNMAGGALLDCLELLALATDGRAVFWDDAKLRRILAFPARAYLGGGWFVNFADCDARPLLSGERLERAGERTGDDALRALGRATRGALADQFSDTPQLWRALNLLLHPARTPLPPPAPAGDVYLPDLQLRVRARDGLTLCCKGGHNGESHNHNDVGSFMLYAGDEPLIVDAGNMTYTQKTFSDARYTLWNVRAAWHNVPLIGGCEQQPGRERAARAVRPTPGGLELDIAPAYGPEAGVKTCLRSLALEEGATLRLRERIELDAPREVTWVFLLRERPVPAGPGCLCAGRLRLRFDSDLQARVEERLVDDPRMARCFPGSLYRLTLQAPPAARHDRTFTAQADARPAPIHNRQEA